MDGHPIAVPLESRDPVVSQRNSNCSGILVIYTLGFQPANGNKSLPHLLIHLSLSARSALSRCLFPTLSQSVTVAHTHTQAETRSEPLPPAHPSRPTHNRLMKRYFTQAAVHWGDISLNVTVNVGN